MPQKSVTVYVVDDDESIRRAPKRLLKSMGYNAVTFESAEEFLNMTSCHGRGCLVLDIRLPGMTGLDLQEKLALSGAKYAVIFMTAHDNPQWQYTSIAFGQLCRRAGVRPSMGSVGDCYDNTLFESFFATLECELLDRCRFRTQADARMGVFDYIEGWYNPHRRHSSLNQVSPVEFERRHLSLPKTESPYLSTKPG
jgi:CheY-like chemotaxis protein